jgi:hypothetical protein
MKKYLMTWYGITDFRASLGLEASTGPVLGALLADSYSNVVILGYTKLDKTKPIEENETENFEQKLLELKDSTQAMARPFINQFANTEEAHNHFIKWLQKCLQDAGKTTTVDFNSVLLNHLNDTEGIYEAATQSLNEISTKDGEKLVTLFLSPGTPVMAFVWAFAALRHPTLKKRLLASSQADKPPEKIVLPNEWLEWHGKQVRTTLTDSTQYDVIFHLFGEQRMPSLLGVMQFPSRKHVFVNSGQFPAEVMKQFIGEAEFGELSVDPYDPESVRAAILKLIEENPANVRVGFNLTGGTKLMYAGALAACRKVNATPFYFDSRNNKVIFLDGFHSFDTQLISSVETFIKLNGNHLFISNQGHWDDVAGADDPNRTALTKKLWSQRFIISGLYRRLADGYNDNPGRNFQLHYRHEKANTEITASLKEGHKAEILIKRPNGKESVYRFQNWPDFARYLSGGWFEEYTFLRLQPLVASGVIKDLRIGLQVSFKEESKHDRSSSLRSQLNDVFGDTYQELDIVFTDGRRLYVLECKAGAVKGEYVRKLESITRYFGGIEGQGILACCFPPRSSVVKQKALETRKIKLLAGKDLFEELEALIYKEAGLK